MVGARLCACAPLPGTAAWHPGTSVPPCCSLWPSGSTPSSEAPLSFLSGEGGSGLAGLWSGAQRLQTGRRKDGWKDGTSASPCAEPSISHQVLALTSNQGPSPDLYGSRPSPYPLQEPGSLCVAQGPSVCSSCCPGTQGLLWPRAPGRAPLSGAGGWAAADTGPQGAACSQRGCPALSLSWWSAPRA